MDIRRLDGYRYRGARAMVFMHDNYMRECLDVWEQFDRCGARLPRTDDPDYQSNLHLLHHILRACRGYMTWMCEQLQLPDPGIPATPEIHELRGCYREYLEDLLEKWIDPLRNVPPGDFVLGVFESRWHEPYSIDSMLEHAVMHPLRHAFQLRELMGSQSPL